MSLNKGMLTSNTCEWETPKALFEKLDEQFHFTLDPCATPENAKCAKFYTKEENGLKQDWTGETVFCNPPYGREQVEWIRKCAMHGENGDVAVMLIPARTDTKVFHDLIWGKAEVWFLRGRLKFGGGKKQRAVSFYDCNIPKTL